MRKRVIIPAIIAVVFALSMARGADEKPVQVAVAPFEVRGQEGLQYLQDGLFDMLSSRLFVQGKTQVLPREKAVQAAAQPSGEKGVDYLVTGTINAIGDRYSIDVRVMDVQKNSVLLTSSYAQKSLDDVIPWVDRFAKEILDKIAPQGALASVPAPTPGPPGRPLAPGGAAGAPPKADNLLNPEFIRQFRSEALTPKFWRSQEFPVELRSMDIGDVDGDGQNETVIADDNNLWVFRYQNGRLAEMFHYKDPHGAEFLSVDVGDFNGNGRAEIYVSAMAGYRMESFVLEYDGSQFRPIAERLSHHTRVAYVGDAKPALVGQNRTMTGAFHGPIYRLEWQSRVLKRGADVKLPVNPGIYSFALADIISGEKGNLVALDVNDKLCVYDATGKMKWRSRDFFGGSQRAKEEEIDDRTGPSQRTDMNVTAQLAYSPLRILVCDLNGDKQNELLINRNYEAFGKYLQRLRLYSGGEIHNLIWDGLTLTTNWQTQKFDGYVADFQLKDIDNDGQDELVIALVLRTEWLDILKKRSAVIAYHLNIPKADSIKKTIDKSGPQ